MLLLFITGSPGLQLLGFRKQKTAENGEILVSPIGAEFFHGGAMRWAVDQALAHEPFQRKWDAGLPQDQPREAMVGTFDTDAYAKANGLDEETKTKFETWLLNHPLYGQYYIKADSPEELMEEPWKNYHNTQWKQVPFIAKEIGVDLEYVLEFERTHKNRPGVVAVLEEALGVQPVAA